MFYLIALCGALSLPAMAVAAFMTWQYAASETERLKDTCFDIDNKIIFAIERMHAADISALRALATSPAIQNGHLSSFLIQAYEFVGYNMPGARMFLRGQDGQILVDTDSPNNAAAASQWVDPDTNSPNHIISNLIRGKSFIDSSYQVSIPVRVDDDIKYDLSVRIPLTRLAQLLKDQNLDPDYTAVIVDGNGIIIARTHNNEQFFGKMAEGVAANPKADNFSWSGKTLHGIRIHAVFRRAVTTRWGAGAGISQHALYAPLYRSLLWLLLMAGSILLFGVGLAWWLASILSRSAVDLVATARAIGDEEMKSFPLSPIVEANVIGIAITAASNRLRQQADQLLQANADLENQVNDRTRELTDKTLLLGTTLAHMDQGLMVIDENKRVQLYNARAAELTGTPESILAGFSSVSDNIEYLKKHGIFEQTPEDMQLLFDDALKPDQTIVNERENPDGTVIEVRTVPLEDGRFVRTFTDVTDRKRAERRLEHFVTHDPLTGLANRTWFREHLKQAIALGSGGERAFALFILHLGGVGEVNAAHGFAVGDALLVTFAEKLKSAISVGALLMRLDGSIFAVAQPVDDQGQNIAVQTQHLIRDLPGCYVAEGVKIEVNVSIGIAMYPSHGSSIDELNRNANVALNEAIRTGGNHCRMYEAPGQVRQAS